MSSDRLAAASRDLMQAATMSRLEDRIVQNRNRVGPILEEEDDREDTEDDPSPGLSWKRSSPRPQSNDNRFVGIGKRDSEDV